MNNFNVYYPLRELDSFIEKLSEKSFTDFSFEDPFVGEKKHFVLFSFEKDSEVVYKAIEIFEKNFPLPYTNCNEYYEKALFTVLCYITKNDILDCEIYGLCGIECGSDLKSSNGDKNSIIVSLLHTSDSANDTIFAPDLDSVAKVLGSLKESSFNKITIVDPLTVKVLPSSTRFDMTLKELHQHFKFKEI